MLTRDYLMDEAERLSRFLAQVVFHSSRETSLEEAGYTIRQNELLLAELRRMVAAGEINQGENRLFVALENNPTESNFAVAMTFYQDLSRMDDETLQKAGFCREEIWDGIQGVRKLAKSKQKELE